MSEIVRPGVFIVLALLVVSSWALIATIRRLLRQRAGMGRWVALAVLMACGIGLGIWCGFYCEYSVGTRWRFGGFPMPMVVFHLEDGDWVDFPAPEFQAWMTAITNVIIITALFTAPLWLEALRNRKHEGQQSASGRVA